LIFGGSFRERSPDLAKETVEVPITGKIISVDVKIGDKIKEGDVLCVLESMKMENPILSPVDGKVVEIGVKADQVVKPGEVIAVIEY
jgi:biotin carboxyl carrier protein